MSSQKFTYASVTDPVTGTLVEFGNTYTVLLAVTIDFTNTRSVITVPPGFKPLVSAYLWGAGGGGGGYDASRGGWGAGGAFVRHDFEVAPGDTVEVAVGGGGGAGTSGTSNTGGLGGPSRLYINGWDSFSGATGGRAGPSGWSGSGGGGGGATVLIKNDNVIAVAGGGGGAGGGGWHGVGADGINTTGVLTVYPAPLWGTYPDFLNQHGIWNQDTYSGSFDQTFTVNFPSTDTYTFTGTADNECHFYVDGVEVLSGSNWGQVYSTTYSVAAGTHSIRLRGINWGGPASIGLTIDGGAGRVFDSRTPPVNDSPYKNGSEGGSTPWDGGGGGGGGGGWIGAEGGIYAPSDVGGAGGGTGTCLYNITLVDSSGPYTGGTQIPFYVAPAGQGGNPAEPGADGLAVLIFRPEPNGWRKNDAGDWKQVVGTWIKTAETNVSGHVKPEGWHQVRGVWIKTEAGWKKLAESGSIDVNYVGYTDNYGTLGRTSPWQYVPPVGDGGGYYGDWGGGGDGGGSSGGGSSGGSGGCGDSGGGCGGDGGD